jgi:protein-S-isoprenylcysteine O-methyltransferase Ste14
VLRQLAGSNSYSNEALPAIILSVMIYAVIVAGCWLFFVVIWLLNSTKAKRDVTRRGSGWTALAIRVIAVGAVLLVLRIPVVRNLLQSSRTWFSFSRPIVGIIGSALCVIGVALAVWARVCLATNWSPRPAVKVDHALVTSGPYRLIRHPIYTGMLLALLGTGLDAGIIGLAVFVCAAAVLVRRIPIEEGLMMQLFKEQYSEYIRHTKALLPFLL